MVKRFLTWNAAVCAIRTFTLRIRISAIRPALYWGMKALESSVRLPKG